MAKIENYSRPPRPGSSAQDKYSALDLEWRRIGLGVIASKALVEAKLYKVSDLRKISLEELTAIQGIGKSSIARLKLIMEAKKISFR
ncbi:MAG: hypothetical protein F2609_05630 [Actinobacteria bacterium]|nr:hypothetical protein [Actinomycetota bacterium]